MESTLGRSSQYVLKLMDVVEVVCFEHFGNVQSETWMQEIANRLNNRWNTKRQEKPSTIEIKSRIVA